MERTASVDAVSTALYEAFENVRVGEMRTYTDSFGMTVGISVYAKGPTDLAPVVLYVIRHSGEYPGRARDEDVVGDLLDEGYIVVLLDYGHHPLAVSPRIEKSVQVIRLSMIRSNAYLEGLGYDKTKTYIVPSGYRLVRDLVYFDIAAQSSREALDATVRTWNTQSSVAKAVFERFGESHAYDTGRTNARGEIVYALRDEVKAKTVYDILMKDGRKMTDADMRLSMDLIYPADPSPDAEIPVIALAASTTPRNGSTASLQHEERIQHAGFLFRGYAVVTYDHDYVPFMNADVGGWRHLEPFYTIQNYDGTKTHTAAIRCIKYWADTYKYSKTAIGVFGHSKASWCSLLSHPDAEALPEESGLCPPRGPQPFLHDADGMSINAAITCCYHSMGNGSARFEKYLTERNVPTVICNGQKDSGSGNRYWEAEREAYRKSGTEFLAIPMIDRGHTYPIGNDPIYEYNRYVAFYKFFDYHLKGTAPEILYTSVKGGRLWDVRTTPEKYTSTSRHWEIVEGEELFVQFVAPVTEESFLGATTLSDGLGNRVEGNWRAEGRGNKWIFTGTLAPGGEYTLTIQDNAVLDVHGRRVEKGITVTFGK